MDAGNIIYIIAIIIYFIYSAVKKGKKGDQPELNTPEDTEQQRERPASFEDLLREIRSGQQEREEDLRNTGQGKVEKPIKRMANETKSVQEEKEYSKVHAFDKYSGSVSDDSTPKLKTLDEQVSLTSEITGLTSTEDDSKELKQSSNNKYRRLLQGRGNVRDAIVLSEILNRKQF